MLNIERFHAHKVERQRHGLLAAFRNGLGFQGCHLVETVHARQAREPVDGPLLAELRHEHVEHGTAVLALHEPTEILDARELPRLRANSVTDAIETVLSANLLPNAVLSGEDVLFVHEMPETPLGVLEELLHGTAFEQVDHVLVHVGDLFLAVCVVHENPAWCLLVVGEYLILILRFVFVLHSKPLPCFNLLIL